MVSRIAVPPQGRASMLDARSGREAAVEKDPMGDGQCGSAEGFHGT